MKRTLHQLVHGYQKGHSLLAGSCSLPRSGLETVTEQSDLSGPLPAGVAIPTYLTAYRVPDTEFYALGRTWPDMDAPRAGCVITHTLLIPIDAWRTVTYPVDYLRLHRRPNRLFLNDFSHELRLEENAGGQPEPVSLSRADVNKFATKVFSEGLRSVVWFDCKAPELLVMTLASLLWPTLRESLYAHTFSLHPHAKVQSDLQLHFAHGGAQSHFSRVPKQCHMSSRPAGNRSQPEQDWISEISDDLCVGRPRQSYLDGLARYGHLLGHDPSAVRTIFALRELKHRLSHNPTAAVGILDVIESLEPLAERAVVEKETALNAAISAALQAPTSTALHCLSLIDARLRRPSFATAGTAFQSVLKDSVEKIVAKQPDTLIAACGQSMPLDDSFFWQGVANGMREAADVRPESLEPLGQCPAIASFLVREAPSIARAYLLASRHRSSAAVSELIQWARHMEHYDERQHLRRVLLPERVDEERVPLLAELLKDVSSSDVDDTLDMLVKSTHGFESAPVRRVVTDFVQRFPAETIRWGQQSEFLQAGYVPEVVAEAFTFSAEGLYRILTIEWMTPNDRCEVLSAFVERSAKKPLPQWFIWHASEDAAIVEPFVKCDLLSPRAKLAMQAIGNQCGYLPLARSTHFEGLILKVARTELAGLFVPKAIDSAIAEHVNGRITEEQMLSALTLRPCEEWCEQIAGSHVHGLLASTVNSDAWQRAWTTLSTLPHVLFRKVAGPEIIADFISSFQAHWTTEVGQAWSRIVVRSHEELPYELGLRLQMESAYFCLRNPRLPVGPVIQEAFPPVYEAVAAAKATHVTDELFGFFGWDKLKKLRKDLIDAYISSCWPPEDLARIADKCRILRKVLHRLRRKLGGSDYISKIVDRLQYEDSSEATSIRSEVLIIVNDPGFSEPWD